MTNPVEQDVEAPAEGDQQHESVEELKARIASLEAEATKHRNIRKKVEQERNQSRAQEEDFKSLYQQELDAKTKLLERVKGSAVNSAVTAQLSKAGVLPDAVEAAAKLVDAGLIEWDEEDGVDSTSVTAAVAKLKSQFGFMFEKKVARTEPKQAADTSTADANEIRKADFYKLDPIARAEAMQKGMRVVD